jgi:uncharacterized membrane protein
LAILVLQKISNQRTTNFNSLRKKIKFENINKIYFRNIKKLENFMEKIIVKKNKN